jgi:hypothetical protein
MQARAILDLVPTLPLSIFSSSFFQVILSAISLIQFFIFTNVLPFLNGEDCTQQTWIRSICLSELEVTFTFVSEKSYFTKYCSFVNLLSPLNNSYPLCADFPHPLSRVSWSPSLAYMEGHQDRPSSHLPFLVFNNTCHFYIPLVLRRLHIVF